MNLPPYISMNDVRKVTEAMGTADMEACGLEWDVLATIALTAYYEGRSELFKNPAAMAQVIACLVKRLGGKVKITQDEIDLITEYTLNSRVNQDDGALDLMTSSIIQVSDEARRLDS